MTNAAHMQEHDDLMRLVMRAADCFVHIDHFIVVTINKSGQPAVGASIGDPATIQDCFRQLGGLPEDSIQGFSEIKPGTTQ